MFCSCIFLTETYLAFLAYRWSLYKKDLKKKSEELLTVLTVLANGIGQGHVLLLQVGPM